MFSLLFLNAWTPHFLFNAIKLVNIGIDNNDEIRLYLINSLKQFPPSPFLNEKKRKTFKLNNTIKCLLFKNTKCLQQLTLNQNKYDFQNKLIIF